MNFESGQYDIALPELPMPLPRDDSMLRLKEIARRARASVRAMQALHKQVHDQLVSEARSLRRDANVTQWAHDARRRLVAPLWEFGVYSSEWDLAISNYASLLVSISTLLPEYTEIAGEFHLLTEQLAALHDEAERMPEIVLSEAHKRTMPPPPPLLRVVSKF